MTRDRRVAVLRDIARVAAVMFDGELAGAIVSDESWRWIRDADRSRRFEIGDNWEVNPAEFIAAKKTLLRLQRLAPAAMAVRCILWVKVPTVPGEVSAIVCNGGVSRWQQFGNDVHKTYPEMQHAFESGEPTDVPEADSGVLTVLAPVRDSLEQISGLVEVSCSAAGEILNW